MGCEYHTLFPRVQEMSRKGWWGDCEPQRAGGEECIQSCDCLHKVRLDYSIPPEGEGPYHGQWC